MPKAKSATTTADTIGARIAAARKKADLSKAAAARAAGLGWDAWHAIEQDRREPSAKTLRSICLALSASADDLLGL